MVPLLFILGSASHRAVVVDCPTLLGRSRRCDVRLDSQSVSRRHAEVQWVDGVAWLCDLNSRNGTFVNGQRISEPTKLHVGDRVRLGDVKMNYRVVAHLPRGLDPLAATGELKGMLTFRCPGCESRLGAKLEMMRSVHVCPRCAGTMVVPELEGRASAPWVDSGATMAPELTPPPPQPVVRAPAAPTPKAEPPQPRSGPQISEEEAASVLAGPRGGADEDDDLSLDEPQEAQPSLDAVAPAPPPLAQPQQPQPQEIEQAFSRHGEDDDVEPAALDVLHDQAQPRAGSPVQFGEDEAALELSETPLSAAAGNGAPPAQADDGSVAIWWGSQASAATPALSTRADDDNPVLSLSDPEDQPLDWQTSASDPQAMPEMAAEPQAQALSTSVILPTVEEPQAAAAAPPAAVQPSSEPQAQAAAAPTLDEGRGSQDAPLGQAATTPAASVAEPVHLAEARIADEPTPRRHHDERVDVQPLAEAMIDPMPNPPARGMWMRPAKGRLSDDDAHVALAVPPPLPQEPLEHVSEPNRWHHSAEAPLAAPWRQGDEAPDVGRRLESPLASADQAIGQTHRSDPALLDRSDSPAALAPQPGVDDRRDDDAAPRLAVDTAPSLMTQPPPHDAAALAADRRTHSEVPIDAASLPAAPPMEAGELKPGLVRDAQLESPGASAWLDPAVLPQAPAVIHAWLEARQNQPAERPARGRFLTPHNHADPQHESVQSAPQNQPAPQPQAYDDQQPQRVEEEDWWATPIVREHKDEDESEA